MLLQSSYQARDLRCLTEHGRREKQQNANARRPWSTLGEILVTGIPIFFPAYARSRITITNLSKGC